MKPSSNENKLCTGSLLGRLYSGGEKRTSNTVRIIITKNEIQGSFNIISLSIQYGEWSKVIQQTNK